MSGHPLYQRIVDQRVVAVIRTETPEQAVEAGRACARGGVRLLEITLTVPRALDVVRALAGETGVTVGVGSVTERDQVLGAVSAGAQFIVSPHFDRDLLAEIKHYGVLSAMGGVTPTEAMLCHRAGVDVTKVFPASSFGGAAHLKALREPLPFLRLMPTGGVDEGNLRTYLEAGACGVGLGGSLVDKAAVKGGDWAAIEEKARKVAAVAAAWNAERQAARKAP